MNIPAYQDPADFANDAAMIQALGAFIDAPEDGKAEAREGVLSAAFDHLLIHGDGSKPPRMGKPIKLGKCFVAALPLN